MTRESTLLHLAASLEEIIDSSIEDSRLRNRFRRELTQQLNDMEHRLSEKIASRLALVPAPKSVPEGLHLSPTTLGKIGKAALKWLLPVLLGGVSHLAMRFLHP